MSRDKELIAELEKMIGEYLRDEINMVELRTRYDSHCCMRDM